MKTLLIGIGAAGNKATKEAVRLGVVKPNDAIIINSTNKDFPKEFEGRKIEISPNNTGCGKERAIAQGYAKNAIGAGKLTLEFVKEYTTIIICTSVEGGTGSGATPIIAKFFNQVYRKNVHVIAFTGFEEDPRGLANTVEFFKEMDSSLIVQTIRNSAFLKNANGNKFKAEELANIELCRRIQIITGQNFIAGNQNIDDTDILKVSNTTGYMTVEEIKIDPLVSKEDFNKVMKAMIMSSKSIKGKDCGAIRLGIILNISPESEDAIDFSFTDLKAAYGNPYECFMQKQWDGNHEYIAYIASGMKMPLAEIEAIYKKYLEESEKVSEEGDSFYKEIQEFKLNTEDKRFNMMEDPKEGTNVMDFLSKF